MRRAFWTLLSPFVWIACPLSRVADDRNYAR
jgi:hypothetical protein